MLAMMGLVCADYWSAKPLTASANYVGRDACIDCHKEQSQKFVGSHHDLAMDLATEESVLGDFDDVTFEHDGLKNRLYRDGDRFMVYTEGEDGEMQDFEVKYVFGVTPLQQYMVEFDRANTLKPNEVARLQVLRISWDTEKKRWFYLRPPDVEEKLEPGDPLHWTGIAQRWQTMCADCHSTNLQRNYDVATNTYHTTFSEIDVSCEACHGPGSLHIEFANSKSMFWDRNHGYGLAKLKGDDSHPQLETCAPCHSRRGVLDPTFKAGDSYHDHYSLESLGRETYHDDGQIKDEVYVFGSFIQSKMYHKGIRCTDCHDPHSLKLIKTGNETCTSCHQHAAGKYDVPSHHHHAPETAGAMCVNCHMPHTTYMEVDKRRDHSLRVPRPDISVQHGTPNACSSCHITDQLKNLSPENRSQFDSKEYAHWLLESENNDEIKQAIDATDKWCDGACEKWYGSERKKPDHFSQPLAKFRAGDETAAAELAALLNKPNELAPAIAKATALNELTQAGFPGVVAVAQKVIENPEQDAIVRSAAINAFTMAGPQRVKRTLVPLLKDESRLIRNEAARVLLSNAYQTLSGNERTQVDLAIQELKTAIMVASDRGGAHMNWAMLCEQQNRVREAQKAYETAIRIQPTMSGPRTNLAALLERMVSQQQLPPQTMQVVKQLRGDEMVLLERDANLAPDNAFVQYRFGLSLYLNGESEKALVYLRKAAELEPEIEDFQLAVKLLLEKLEK